MIPNSSDKIFEHSVRFGNDDDVHYKLIEKVSCYHTMFNLFKSLNLDWIVHDTLTSLFFLTVETLDCLKVDFSNQDFDHLRPSQNDEFLQDVSSIKPEVILTDHIQESQFLMQTNATLRMLGYTGHLGCLQNGRGLGVFVRKDIADRLTLVPDTIFQWENIPEKLLIPNPCDRNKIISTFLAVPLPIKTDIVEKFLIASKTPEHRCHTLKPRCTNYKLLTSSNTVRLWVAFRSGLSLLWRCVLHFPLWIL